MKRNRAISFLIAISYITGISGCGNASDGETAENSATSAVEEIEDETTTEATEAQTTTKATTVTEATTTSTEPLQLYEENSSIVSALTNGFTYESQDDPIIKFNPMTNSYVIVAPSQIAASEFDKSHDDGSFDSLVSSFSDLSDSLTQIASYTDDTSNYKIILTAETLIPVIVYEKRSGESGEVSFDLYSASSQERAMASLETFVYAYEIGFADATYNSTDSSYHLIMTQVGASEDAFSSENWETLVSSLSELYVTMEDNCAIFDDEMQGLTLEYTNFYTQESMLIIEDGNVTYNYKE